MALEDIFMPVFTDAGRAAVAAADGAGLDVTIAEIAFGDAQYAVRDVDGNALTAAVQMTTLTNELLRVSCSAGAAVDAYSILVEAIAAAGAPTFWIGEVGFFLDDGTLLAVASHDTQYIGWRGDVADWVFRFVLSWTDLPASAITVQFNGDAAYSALSVDHERVEAKVRHTVESEGLTWSDPDDTLLTAAVNAKVAAVDVSGKADVDLGNLTGWSMPATINATFGGATYAASAKLYAEAADRAAIWGYCSGGDYGGYFRSETAGGAAISNASTGAPPLYVLASNAAFAHHGLQVEIGRSPSTAFYYASFESQGNAPVFRFRGDGTSFQDGGTAWSTPADYAERFETFDGQDIPVGTTVVLDAGKVRAATAADPATDVMGVVRPKGGDGSIVGNDGSLRWQGKYLRDDFGAFVLTADGERVLNPDYDPDQPYTPRSERPEWVLIGLLGQVPITKGQPVGDRWIKMRDISADVEEWFIR